MSSQPDLFDYARFNGVGCAEEDDCITPMWCRSQDVCPKTTAVAEADEAEERHSKPTQAWLVQTHLESGRTLTPMEALEKYGIGRLAARVLELKRRGIGVQSRMVEVKSGKRVAEYSMGGGDE
jgi:hypothetical protein